MVYIVHAILQGRILEWVAFPFSRVSSQPKEWTQVSHIAGRFFNSWATREAQEYWSGYTIPFPGDPPNPGIEPGSPELRADSLPTQVWFLGREDPLKKGMATHYNILAWWIPWTEEPGGLQSMGSHRVGHDWATNTIHRKPNIKSSHRAEVFITHTEHRAQPEHIRNYVKSVRKRPGIR